MKAYALLFGVVACVVVVNAHRLTGSLNANEPLTALRPSRPEQQLNNLERYKRTLPIVDNVLRGVGETLVGVGHGLFGSRVAPAPVYVPGYFNHVYPGYPNGYYAPNPGYGFYGPYPGAPGFGPVPGPQGFNNGFFNPNGNVGPHNGQYRTGHRYYGQGGNNGPANGFNQGPGYNPTSQEEDYGDYNNNEGSGAGCGFTYRSGGGTNC